MLRRNLSMPDGRLIKLSLFSTVLDNSPLTSIYFTTFERKRKVRSPPTQTIKHFGFWYIYGIIHSSFVEIILIALILYYISSLFLLIIFLFFYSINVIVNMNFVRHDHIFIVLCSLRLISYQLKLRKMRAKLANVNDCAVPFLSRAVAILCWYYYTFYFMNMDAIFLFKSELITDYLYKLYLS